MSGFRNLRKVKKSDRLLIGAVNSFLALTGIYYMIDNASKDVEDSEFQTVDTKN